MVPEEPNHDYRPEYYRKTMTFAGGFGWFATIVLGTTVLVIVRRGLPGTGGSQSACQGRNGEESVRTWSGRHEERSVPSLTMTNL